MKLGELLSIASNASLSQFEWGVGLIEVINQVLPPEKQLADDSVTGAHVQATLFYLPPQEIANLVNAEVEIRGKKVVYTNLAPTITAAPVPAIPVAPITPPIALPPVGPAGPGALPSVGDMGGQQPVQVATTYPTPEGGSTTVITTTGGHSPVGILILAGCLVLLVLALVFLQAVQTSANGRNPDESGTARELFKILQDVTQEYQKSEGTQTDDTGMESDGVGGIERYPGDEDMVETQPEDPDPAPQRPDSRAEENLPPRRPNEPDPNAVPSYD